MNSFISFNLGRVLCWGISLYCYLLFILLSFFLSFCFLSWAPHPPISVVWSPEKSFLCYKKIAFIEDMTLTFRIWDSKSTTFHGQTKCGMAKERIIASPIAIHAQFCDGDTSIILPSTFFHVLLQHHGHSLSYLCQSTSYYESLVFSNLDAFLDFFFSFSFLPWGNGLS